MKKLKNITFGFGEARTSPTTLTSEQMATLVKVILDKDIHTKQFSGFVGCTEPITRYRENLLAVNGITYIGETKDNPEITLRFSLYKNNAWVADDADVLIGDLQPTYEGNGYWVISEEIAEYVSPSIIINGEYFDVFTGDKDIYSDGSEMMIRTIKIQDQGVFFFGDQQKKVIQFRCYQTALNMSNNDYNLRYCYIGTVRNAPIESNTDLANDIYFSASFDNWLKEEILQTKQDINIKAISYGMYIGGGVPSFYRFELDVEEPQFAPRP